MAHNRIDRMTRELQAEPSFQFFQWLFALAAPARPVVQAARTPIRNPYATEGLAMNDASLVAEKAA